MTHYVNEKGKHVLETRQRTRPLTRADELWQKENEFIHKRHQHEWVRFPNGGRAPKPMTTALNELVFASAVHIATAWSKNVNEDERWAGGLEDNVTSVIRGNLASYLNTNESFDYNSNFKSRPDVTVRVRMHEFGRVDNSTIVLNASWELDRTGSSQPQLFTEKFITSIQRNDTEKSKKKKFWKGSPDSDLSSETQEMSQALDQ